MKHITKQVKVKNTIIGGTAPVTIQSMTNTHTRDYSATIEQVRRLEAVGCDIVRLAVVDMDEVKVACKIAKEVTVPLVADIQYDYKLAVACADGGMAKIRINPGNLGGADKLKEVATACKRNGVPIRVGVNAGSLEKGVSTKGGIAAALAKSGLANLKLLEDCGFDDLVVSVKSSNAKVTVDAYRLLAKKCNYPLHIGITESGVGLSGIIKSSVGLGALLLDGLGDTVRVSLSGDPVDEIDIARRLLRASGRDVNFCEVISCPTCGRCSFDLAALAVKVEDMTQHIKNPLKIAVMGCAVNGIGEGKHADLGIAGSKDKAVIFCKGEIIKTVPMDVAEKEFFAVITNEIQKIK
ncbi:MAG: flavodoxin-dependent (E)-4-hydroxy-3-methylbut-2-enyl-diphosphate synthase [Firmicutes bacterium]|nr:flavodoxin-dependent (E)-4-hydroxy-3-methylbut-2-enyl-diphosphate synthase [Bacillota bacterium]